MGLFPAAAPSPSGGAPEHAQAAVPDDVRIVEDELFSERFLVRRPLLRAIAPSSEAPRRTGADH